VWLLLRRSGDSRSKKWGSHYGAKKKVGGKTIGVTDRGARGRAIPLAKQNVKIGTPLVDILICNIL